MLQFSGNRTFVENLMRFLGSDRGGRVVMVTPGIQVVGDFGGTHEAPLERLQKALRDLAHAQLPALAMTILSLVIATILVLFITSSMPPSGTLQSPSALGGRRRPSSHGSVARAGIWGRIAFFASHPDRLIHPALLYGDEVEAELHRRLVGDSKPPKRGVHLGGRQNGQAPGKGAR